MSCCPPDSHPYLKPDANYEHVGQELLSNYSSGLGMYRVGDLDETKRAVVICPDVFGWKGGRVRAIADYFAGSGYFVVVCRLLAPSDEIDEHTWSGEQDGLAPDAEFNLEWMKQYPWSRQEHKLDEAVRYVKFLGATKICMLGFCYGGHPCFWASSKYPEDIVCGAVCHPSMQLEGVFGGDFMGLITSVKAPFLILPAGNDLPMYDPAGSDFASALKASAKGDECAIKVYPEMKHGWTCRGDITDPAVATDVQGAIRDVLAFFNKWSIAN